MNSIAIDRLVQRLAQFIRRSELVEIEYGELGKVNSDGTVTFSVSGKLNFVYVTLRRGDATTIVEARNNTVAFIAYLPVVVKKDSRGVRYIAEMDHDRADSFVGTTQAPNLQVPPHTHEIGFGNEDLVTPRRIQIGLVRANAGLSVQVDPFYYTYNNVRYYFAGGTIDLTGNRPDTADTHAWVAVGLNPITGVLVSETGDEYSTGVTLTAAMIADIALSGYIPLGAVQLENGQTTSLVEADFADYHEWITPGNTLGSAEAIDDFLAYWGIWSSC